MIKGGTRLENATKVIAWVLTAALVSYVIATTDFKVFYRSLRQADILSFLSLTIGFNLAHLVLDSIGVGVLLDRTGVGIPLRRLIMIRAASYLLGFINYNLGLVLIAAAARKGRHVRWQSLASPFLALNVFDLAVVGTILVAGLLTGGAPEIPGAYVPLMVAGVVSMAALVVLVPLSRVGHRKASGLTAGLLDTFRALDVRSVILVLALRAVLLVTDGGGDLLMLRTFNLDIPIDVFARFFPVDSFACVLPITVAGVGPTMVLMRVFFAPFSPASSGSLAAIDAFSVSATTTLVLVRTTAALICMPMVASLWKKDVGKTDGNGT